MDAKINFMDIAGNVNVKFNDEMADELYDLIEGLKKLEGEIFTDLYTETYISDEYVKWILDNDTVVKESTVIGIEWPNMFLKAKTVLGKTITSEVMTYDKFIDRHTI